MIIKQKRQIQYDIETINKIKPTCKVIPKDVIVRVDSKLDNELPQQEEVKTKVLFNLKSKIEFSGDPVAFDVCQYDGHIYFAIISGFRKDNNELIIYQKDLLLLRFKNYHARPFTIVKCVANTRFLVTADMAYDIAFWDYLTGNCIAVWKFHSRHINELICVEQSVKIYSCSSDNSVRSFKVPQSVASMTFSKTKKTVVKPQKLVFSLNYPSSSAFCNEPITCITLGKIKKESVVIAGSVYSVRIYKEMDMKLKLIIPLNDFKLTHSMISKVVFIDESNILAISKNQIKWVDIREKQVLKTFSDRQLDDNKSFDIVVHPNHYLIAASTVENPQEALVAWTLEGKPMKRIFNCQLDKIKHIAFVDSKLYSLRQNSELLTIQIE